MSDLRNELGELQTSKVELENVLPLWGFALLIRLRRGFDRRGRLSLEQPKTPVSFSVSWFCMGLSLSPDLAVLAFPNKVGLPAAPAHLIHILSYSY